jgi:hypothetical protein
MAGKSLRCVRSPVAPNMVMMQDGAHREQFWEVLVEFEDMEKVTYA